ncbi:transcriptional regulator [Exiguobacterium sp. s168]|uniref:transcriptional regulator n=1 Tax=Exiguobacterium sp. s168 TaxID=2751194 RepID=UPI001BE526D3
MNFNLFKNHVRFKIALELIDREDGLSIMQLNQRLTDVPQSTLYRQVNAMMGDQLLKVVAVQRVGKVEEKIYALNTSGYQISEADWNSATYDEKVNFVSFYFMYVLQQYQTYFEQTVQTKGQDHSTFSIAKLQLTDETFKDFQQDMRTLLEKYHHLETEDQATERTVSLVILP